MAVKTIEYQLAPQTQTDRRHSQTIWYDCPWDQIANGEKDGVAYADDFNDLPLTPTLTTQIAYGRYKAYAASTNTITNVGTVNSVVVPGGVLQLAEGGSGASADNICVGQAYPSYFLSGSVSTSQKLWFECRVAISTLTANHGAFFVGLVETTGTFHAFDNTHPFTSNTGLAIDNGGAMVGWKTQMAQTISGQLNAVYSDRATSFTFVGASNAADGTLSAAYTFTKLGFVYDPSEKSGNQIKFYQDGVYVGQAISATTLAGTTNLKANALGLGLFWVGGSAVASGDAMYMDWWRCAQLYSLGGD